MKIAALFFVLIIIVAVTTIEFQKKVLKRPVHPPAVVSKILPHTTPLPAGYRSFDGVYMCVPPIQKPSPTAWTQECVSGIKLDDGTYIGVSTSDFNDIDNILVKGTKVHISGVFVPIEQLAKSKTEKYPIKGVITIKELSK